MFPLSCNTNYIRAGSHKRRDYVRQSEDEVPSRIVYVGILRDPRQEIKKVSHLKAGNRGSWIR